MTTFRVTSTSIREAWLQATQNLQSQLGRTQLQVSTGKKFASPAEDPVAATRSLQLDGSLQTNQQFTGNADLAKNRLSLEESALAEVSDVLQRLRQLAVQANNATQTTETRAAIANEVRQQLDALVQLGNTQDGSGEYLFGGYRSHTQPFSTLSNSIVYNGDQGVRQLQIGPDRRIADGDTGDSVFVRIPNGNGTFLATAAGGNTGTGIVGATSVVNPTLYDGRTYTVTFTSPTAYEVYDDTTPTPVLVTSGTFTSGQSIGFAGVQFGLSGSPAAGDQFTVARSQNQSMFETVQNFIAALTTPSSGPVSQAQVNNQINRSLTEIDQALGQIQQVRSGVGSRLSAIDVQQDVNADVDLNLQSLLSELRDLDYAEALTRLQQQLTSLQAAQSSYAQMQGLSLFNYL